MRIWPRRPHHNERDRVQLFAFRPGPRRGGPGWNHAWGICLRVRRRDGLWRHFNFVLHERGRVTRPGARGTIIYEFATWLTDAQMRRYKTMKVFVRLKIGLGGIEERRSGVNYDNRQSHYWRKYRPGRRAA